MAQAVICKTVDADGVVSYADVPAAECPQKVDLPDYSRYAPRLIPEAAAEDAAAPARERFTGYKSIDIVQPKPGGSVRNNEGKVPVSILLDPALQPGHRVGLIVDGRALSGTFDGLAIELSGVQRGTHELQAVISDASGKRLIQSSPVQFTMRQASRLEPLRQEGGEAQPAPGDSAGQQQGTGEASGGPAVVETQPTAGE
jgi:hypothetical protein